MVGSSISGALSTRAATYFEIDERELGVVVQYREEDRQTLEQLKKLPVAFGNSPLPRPSRITLAFPAIGRITGSSAGRTMGRLW